MFRSKDGKVRKILVGYKFDTEQGNRHFKTVERPVREVVKLMNLDDTTLLEDIKAVREASKIVLEDMDTLPQVASNAACFVPKILITYACNQTFSIDPVLLSSAVDIGTHAIRLDEADADACCRNEIGQVERDLRMNDDLNDDIFDINDYDETKFDDDYLLLL